MQLAADLESSSEHPLAKAVMEHAKTSGISNTAVHDFQALPGNGLSAVRRRRSAAGWKCFLYAAEGKRGRGHDRTGKETGRRREKHRCFLPRIIPVPVWLP